MFKRLSRHLLPGLLLWAVMLMPLLGTLAHGSLAHHPGMAESSSVGLHEHLHGSEHDHGDEIADDKQRVHEHGADHSHDPSKLLPRFTLISIKLGPCWSLRYCFSLPPEPISLFERPPKSQLV